MDPAFSRIEKNSTLTHAVLILENPGEKPIPVVLSRPGFLRKFVLPPKGAMRQLVPAGPLKIRHGEREIRVNILEKTQNTLILRI